MAESIYPKEEDRRNEEHSQLLSCLAASCHAQGSYHLACKKYTQAGDRVMAMKVMCPSCAILSCQAFLV
jgi:intraflagellar transport protein 140